MLKVCAIQMSMLESKEKNINNAIDKVKEAAAEGAKIILLPELFESLYFCKDKDTNYFSWARTLDNNPIIKQFCALAKSLHVVLPISYFEKDVDNYYNALVVIDADGTIMPNYRKTHIPSGPGYEEKFYFTPGDTGFRVYDTVYAKIGMGICWDQWFSESARILALKGAELILYPTAIGSEPEVNIDSSEHWKRVQMGHAAANTVPVIAANRVGKEVGKSCIIDFYGSSFLTDYTGTIIVQAPRNQEALIYAEYDLEKNRKMREYWELLSDRRPNMYIDIVKS